MKSKKIHKLDLIFIIGLASIIMIGSMVDAFSWRNVEQGGFPVFAFLGILASYGLWFVLFVYSILTYKKKEDKPRFVKWYMFFLLPYIGVLLMVVGFTIARGIIKIFGI